MSSDGVPLPRFIIRRKRHIAMRTWRIRRTWHSIGLSTSVSPWRVHQSYQANQKSFMAKHAFRSDTQNMFPCATENTRQCEVKGLGAPLRNNPCMEDTLKLNYQFEL